MGNLDDKFGDQRLKKSSGVEARGSRDEADASRTMNDGGSLSAEERRRLLRNEWVQSVLPQLPNMPGYHLCWLSTTNSTDPIYKRIQRGYQPVKASEIPGFGSQYQQNGGDYDGCIACNEMLLFKVPLDLFNDLMTIYHHDIPLEQEQSISERVSASQEYDSTGRALGTVEGNFNNLGKRVANPTFIS